MDIYNVNPDTLFTSYVLRHEARTWYLNGVKTYSSIPIEWTLVSGHDKEELLVWADMNNIKIDYEK